MPVRGNPLSDLPEWSEEFTEHFVDESVQARRDAPASSPRESASEPRAKVVSGKHSVETHFQKDRNCEICMRTKITRAPYRRRIGEATPRAIFFFGDLIAADHKVLISVEDVNLETIIDTLSWYKSWQLNGFSLIRARLKLFRRHKGAYSSSWRRRGNEKSFTLRNT